MTNGTIFDDLVTALERGKITEAEFYAALGGATAVRKPRRRLFRIFWL